MILLVCTFSETEKKIKEVDGELRELTTSLKTLTSKQSNLEEEKFELDGDVDKQSAKLHDKEADYQVLMKDYEYAKEREAVLMGDRWVKAII